MVEERGALERLGAELARFDEGLPVESAWTIPGSWYADPAFLDLEARTVFRATWQAVGRADQVARPGDYFAGELLGEPYLVVRGADGELRAFANVCRHHAARIAQGEGRLEKLVCPYHGWTYGLAGELRSAPRMAGVQAFDRERFSLVPLRIRVAGPFVFLRWRDDPDATLADLAALEERLMPARGRLAFCARRSYELACNWKVYVDNYLDGGYHVPHLHGNLGGQLDLDAYRTELGPRSVVQSCPAAPAPSGEDLAERIGTGAVYVWLYPNFTINRYGPFLDTNWVRPLAHDRTEVVFDYYVEEGAACDPEFLQQSLAASHAVQVEDTAVCESVQVGLGSASYDRGRYAPRVEHGMHHFHRLLARDLKRAAP